VDPSGASETRGRGAVVRRNGAPEKRSRRGVRRRGGSERGAVLVEYAAVLALVVVAAAVGLSGLDAGARVVLERQAECVAAAPGCAPGEVSE